MRRYASRSAALAALGAVLLLPGAGSAVAAQEHPPASGPMCQLGGGVPVSANLGPFGSGTACFGGANTGVSVNGHHGTPPLPKPSAL